MNQNVRKITDGAMMVAIIGLVLIINRQFAGLLQAYILFLFPLPMVFFGAKYGYKNGLVPLVAITVLSFLLGTITTMFYVVSESIIGLIYGGGIKKGINPTILLIATMIGAVVVNLLSGYIFAAFFGYNLAEDMQLYQQVFDEAGVSASMGVSLTQLLPLLLIISTVLVGIMEGFLTSIISRFMLKRLKFAIAPAKPINEIIPPKWTGYVALGLFLCAFYEIRAGFGNEMAQNVIISIGIIGGLYLMVFGCIGLMMLLKFRFKAPVGVTVIVVMFCILMLFIFVVLAGFLYISTNLRTILLERATYDSKAK